MARYPRELRHHAPKDHHNFPLTQSLAPSPHTGSRLPPASELVRTERSGIEHRNSRECDPKSELQLPILSGPPNTNRHSCSSTSSSFSDARTSLASVSTSTTYPGTGSGSPASTPFSGAQTPDKLESSKRSSPIQSTLPPLVCDNSYGQVFSYGQNRPSSSRSGHESGGHQSGDRFPPVVQSLHLPPFDYPTHTNSRPHPQLHNAPPANRDAVHDMRDRHYHDVSFENVEVGEQRTKRRRGNLPKQVTDMLRCWFSEHIAHPYPTEDEKQLLMNETGLTISQVS